MNEPRNSDTLSDQVLARIRSGNVTMRPRIYFVLATLVTIFVTVLILLTSVLLVSFISFDLRMSGHESLLAFGARGSLTFLSVFPWGLALFDIALVVLLAWLLRRFRFGYRKPLLALLLILLGAGAISGLLFDRETNFHDDRYEEAEAGELFAPLESLYERVSERAPQEQGIYRGFVTDIEDESFTLTFDDHDRDEDDGVWNVLPPDAFDITTLMVGDRVYVAGDADDTVIRAYGIRVLR